MDRQLGDIRPATEPDDEAALPRFELDRPLVLLAGAVLREQEREVAVIDPEHHRRADVSPGAPTQTLRQPQRGRPGTPGRHAGGAPRSRRRSRSPRGMGEMWPS